MIALTECGEGDEKERATGDISVRIDEASPYNGAVRYVCACALDSGSALIFGGYENMNQKNKKSTDRVWFYSSSINQYFEMKPLPFPGSFTAARTPDNKVVLVGSGKMVIYTPNTKKEDHEVEQLPFPVDSGTAIVFDGNNNLHLFGGKKNQTQHWMIQWAETKAERNIVNVGNVPNPCYFSGVCSVENKLFVMGRLGSYDAPKQNSLWIYDVVHNTWKNGADLPLKRAGFGCHLVDDNREIILIGNRYGGKGSDVVLLYNIQQNKWREAVTKLKQHIGFLATVVLEENGEIHGFSGYSEGKNVDTHFVVKYVPGQ